MGLDRQGQTVDFVGEGVGGGRRVSDYPLSWNFKHLAEAKALKQPSRGVALRPSFAEIAFSDFWPLATAPKSLPPREREKASHPASKISPLAGEMSP